MVKSKRPPQNDIEEKELHALIGESISKWNYIEDTLAFLFCAALGAEDKYAMTAYYAVISFEARLAMVDAVVSLRLKSDLDTLAEWRSISSKVGKKARKRAEIAHCAVITANIEGEYVTEALPFFTFSKLFTGAKRRPGKLLIHKDGNALSIGDLRARINSFVNLNHQLVEIEKRLEASIRQQGKSLRPKRDH